jgi:hypothetical protein
VHSVILFVASALVTTCAEARPDWLHAPLPQSAPHAIDLSPRATFPFARANEDADMPLLKRSSPGEQLGGSILPHILGMQPSDAELLDGRGRKHHHMVTYGLDSFHPFGGNVSGSVGTRGAMLRLTWPNGQ